MESENGGRRRSRSGDEPVGESPPQRTKTEDKPNWLVCSSCQAPIATASELVSQKIECLKDACYAYELELLDTEVTVYSATNTNDHRFDVVRANLDETLSVPDVSSKTRLAEKEAIRSLLNHFRGIAAVVYPQSEQSPEEILRELEQLESQEDASSASGPPSPKDEDVLISDRVQTSKNPTEEYSWFPGYSWTIAACKVCGDHLGWTFWSPDDDGWRREFLSLIVTRLREKHLDS